MSSRIRFMCPACKAAMDAPLARAGQKTNCLSCGQRIQIPDSQRAKTILAPSLGIENDGDGPPEMRSLSAGPPALPSEEQVASNTTVPGTLMTASALLIAYGGLILFLSCFYVSLAITSASHRQPNPNGSSRGASAAIGFLVGGIQFAIGVALIASGVAVFRRWPVGRWGGLAAMLVQIILIVGETALTFFLVNVRGREPLFLAEAAIVIAMALRFLPYGIWLAFAVPIGILLHSPSAKAALAGRSLFGRPHHAG